MPSRRAVLHTVGIAGVGVVSGCTAVRPPSTAVDIRLMNFVPEERTVTVVVSHGTEEVFRAEETLPAADPEGPAETMPLPDAFDGNDGQRFTVAVTPAGRPTDVYDYQVTCADFDTEDAFSVWLLDPRTSEDGERTDFTTAHCSER